MREVNEINLRRAARHHTCAAELQEKSNPGTMEKDFQTKSNTPKGEKKLNQCTALSNNRDTGLLA